MIILLLSQSRGNWTPKSNPCSNLPRAGQDTNWIPSLEDVGRSTFEQHGGSRRKQCRFPGTGKDNLMILGMKTVQFVLLHVYVSLVGIAAGFFLVYGLLTARRLRILTALFFVTTTLTSLTGFLFPFKGMTPGIVLGILSLIALALAIVGLYVKKLAGPWRGIYVVSAMVAFYFNFFVLIAQSFAKVPELNAVAPSQASPGFGLTQLGVLIVFILLTVRALKRFHPV
jgi:hypothetical protein